ncbi:MAG: nucleotidyltransferase [Phormidesmis priestleyi]|uniref:Nucleotidyltransferase n=1 Tax=Phormidesmis priestleyi TaxID=268141 RepID=A0A2W4WYC7_9CYAN|nr:MAG: nucleotidyltransferase [Phormidesmis priestleyi]
MSDLDIRWKQRFSSYKRALAQLTKFIHKGELNELEQQGLIQAFEYTHELAWKLLKSFLDSRGVQDIYGSKDATRSAFNLALIEDGESWMDMIKDRNRTSHTYNQAVAEEIVANITQRFFSLFVALKTKMQEIHDAE